MIYLILCNNYITHFHPLAIHVYVLIHVHTHLPGMAPCTFNGRYSGSPLMDSPCSDYSHSTVLCMQSYNSIQCRCSEHCPEGHAIKVPRMIRMHVLNSK